MGVYHLEPRKVHRELTRSALSGDRPSPFSEQVLRLSGLFESFRSDPAGALTALREKIIWDFPDNYFFAMAELSFLYGTRGGGRTSYVEAAAFAYAFLAREGTQLDPFDPRVRLAADLYNQALARALVDPESGEITVSEGPLALRFGSLEVTRSPEQLSWGDYQLTDLQPAAELGVRGILNRYRRPGIGAALVASVVPPAGSEEVSSLVPASIKVAVTVVLRFDDIVVGLRSGALRGHLEVYASDV